MQHTDAFSSITQFNQLIEWLGFRRCLNGWDGMEGRNGHPLSQIRYTNYLFLWYFCLVRFSFHLSISIQISKLNFFEIEFLPEWGTNCEPPGPETPDLPMSQVTPLNILSVKTCSRDWHNLTGNVTLFIYYSVLLKLSNFFTMKTTYLGMNSEGNAPFIVHYTLG